MKMKRKKFLKDLRKMSDEQLEALLHEFQLELHKFSAHGESVGLAALPPHPMYLRNAKKAVARIKTVMRERNLGISR